MDVVHHILKEILFICVNCAWFCFYFYMFLILSVFCVYHRHTRASSVW